MNPLPVSLGHIGISVLAKGYCTGGYDTQIAADTTTTALDAAHRTPFWVVVLP
jgi:L-lactate permease